MKAFLIDPDAETITVVEQNGLEDIYKLLDCRRITTAAIGADDVIYLDDEILDADPLPASFMFGSNPAPMVGKGLCVGSDDEGNDDVPAHGIIQLTARIKWLGIQRIEPDIDFIPFT
ncbi:hypothetical protein [Spirosoma sp.]|uniref:DUF3846 domain-containing protein n=1 Tax=Spirosoma sp. TaxID=1899569 RepID=UPI00260C7E9A|nr:hypothetical protein [Spirosoma sp.]MCX6218370.1 hypothetical protein [Spirosoma sp.]